MTALGLVNVNRFSPIVVAPKDARPVPATKLVAPPSHCKRSEYAVFQLVWLAVVGSEYPAAYVIAKVPEVVIGFPVTDKPIGTVISTEVTVPDPPPPLPVVLGIEGGASCKSSRVVWLLPPPVKLNMFKKNRYHSRDINPVRGSINSTLAEGKFVMLS